MPVGDNPLYQLDVYESFFAIYPPTMDLDHVAPGEQWHAISRYGSYDEIKAPTAALLVDALSEYVEQHPPKDSRL
jgi:hypothetical protein